MSTPGLTALTRAVARAGFRIVTRARASTDVTSMERDSGVQPGRQAAGQRRRRRHRAAVGPGHRPAPGAPIPADYAVLGGVSSPSWYQFLTIAGDYGRCYPQLSEAITADARFSRPTGECGNARYGRTDSTEAGPPRARGQLYYLPSVPLRTLRYVRAPLVRSRRMRRGSWVPGGAGLFIRTG